MLRVCGRSMISFGCVHAMFCIATCGLLNACSGYLAREWCDCEMSICLWCLDLHLVDAESWGGEIGVNHEYDS